MTVHLTLREVAGSTRPSIDRRGLLFEWEGRILRAFRDEPAELIAQLLAAPWLPELFELGLIPFRQVDVELEGYSLLVEVDRVPFVTYASEWPVAMLRDAGIMIARLGERLAQHGLGLQDAHPWNVLFRGSRPVFVDLGSIVESPEVTGAWVEEFRRNFALPLALHRAGLHGLADSVQGIERGWFPTQLGRRRFRLFPLGFRVRARHRTEPVRFYRELAAYLASGPAHGAETVWSDYDRTLEKQGALELILAGLPPGRLLDVGANAGWFSRLAARAGHDVLAIDNDDHALEQLYHEAGAEGLSIVPVRMDFLWPTGSSGFGLECRPATERFNADTVAALAVLHHLVGHQRVTFEAFARMLNLFTGQHAIVEFIPSDDTHVRGWHVMREPWYTKAGFIDAMSPFFELTRELPSYPAPRSILVFERLRPDPASSTTAGVAGAA